MYTLGSSSPLTLSCLCYKLFYYRFLEGFNYFLLFGYKLLRIPIYFSLSMDPSSNILTTFIVIIPFKIFVGLLFSV